MIRSAGRPLLTSVSDTARWVAAYRARETARPHALFRDPFAARLAGERGQAIAHALDPFGLVEWSVVFRTMLLDEAVLRAVHEEGVEVVLNMAAGWDMRPYRLPLPPSLTWIEADLPGLVAEKEELVAGEAPVCQLEREAVDLTDDTQRRALLDRVETLGKRTLVITEGLLVYLDERAVRELALDLSAHPHVVQWAMDLYTPVSVSPVRWANRRALKEAGAMFRFYPENPRAFFASTGWIEARYQGLSSAAQRVGRSWIWGPLWRLLPAPVRLTLDRTIGVAVLRRPS